MLEVIFLPAARLDYDETLAWYQERSTKAAAGFEAAVEVALQRIAKGPEHWGRIDSRHRSYILRRFPCSIIYRIEPTVMVVVAVAHTSRRNAYWRDR